MTMVGVVDELTTMAGEVDDLAGELAGCDAPAMASTMRAIGGLVAAAQRLEVRAAAHFTRLGAFRAAGAASTAGWLRTRRGLGGGAAKQIEDAARAISAVGVVRGAVERGAMSVAHAALLVGLCDRVRLGDLAEAELMPLVDKAGELAVDRFRQEVRTLEARLDAAAGRDPARGNAVRSHDGDAGRKVWRAELDAESHDIGGTRWTRSSTRPGAPATPRTRRRRRSRSSRGGAATRSWRWRGGRSAASTDHPRRRPIPGAARPRSP